MAVTITNQYQFPASTETDENSPLTVRLVRDLADAINNAKFYACNSKLWSYVWVPKLRSKPSNTNNMWVFGFFPRYVSPEFNRIRLTIGHVRTAGAGSTNWTVYAAKISYQGPQVINTDFLGPVYNSVSFTTSSDTHAIYTSESLAIPPTGSGSVYLIIAANNTDSSTDSGLRTFDATPRFVST